VNSLGDSNSPKKIREYILNEYKNNPVKTIASTLAILVILSGFVFFVYNNFINYETSPKKIDIYPKISQVPDNKSLIAITNNTSDTEQNLPPKLYGLNSDKSSPQIEGSSVTWIADALDDNSDPILFKFFLNGKAMTEWSQTDSWIWNTAETDVGENQIEVRIRDGNHSGPNGFDDRRTDSFTISAQGSTPKPPPVSPTPIASPQENKSPATIRLESHPKCPKSNIDSISPSNPEVGQDVRFVGHAELCPDGSKIRTYELSSDIDGDLNSGGHTMPLFNFKFKTPGDHNLTFKIIDNRNRQDSVNQNIKVNPAN
jgi:hypothetical protein